jgi:hypothetical protein
VRILQKWHSTLGGHRILSNSREAARRLSRKFAPLLFCFGAAWGLSACATSPRPSQLRPDDVVGCYLVNVVGDDEDAGLFPDTIGLDSTADSVRAGVYGTRITVGQAGRYSVQQWLGWRMIGADSLEISGTVASIALDLRARLTADGFAGFVAFANGARTTTDAVTATRAYCVGFGVPPKKRLDPSGRRIKD